MKTQANKTLHFKKGSITELNDASLSTINGGTNSIEYMESDVEVRSVSKVMLVKF